MDEFLTDTYARLKQNMANAKAKLISEPTEDNNIIFKRHFEIYTDFCCTFTENMLNAIKRTINDVEYM